MRVHELKGSPGVQSAIVEIDADRSIVIVVKPNGDAEVRIEHGQSMTVFAMPAAHVSEVAN
jgi:hypothetical protein